MSHCLIIAEVALSHDGSLGIAHSYIDAIGRTGADAVKFQTHLAGAESTVHEPWRVRFSHQDGSRYDYWKRTEFSEDQWRQLRSHAAEVGLMFLSSPFSVEAVELLSRIGVSAWKIPSGELGNPLLLDRITATGLPVIASTGLSTFREIDNAVGRLTASGVDVTLLQCTSMYPTAAEMIGLNVLNLFRERYGCKVGLSDHSGTLYAGLAAAALGADVVEVHVTFSREMFGPDAIASLTLDDLRRLVEGTRFIERALNNPVNKDELAGTLAPMRELFTKSIVAGRDIPAGTILQESHLTVKKPGTGLPAARFSSVLGRRVVRPVKADDVLTEADLE